MIRCGWELLCYVIMDNHLHLMLKTPRPNLAGGMRGISLGIRSLGSDGGGKRRGHLFQGRYRAEMIEDESYYWTVSRYIHLNPVRARLVERPEQWEWSSYPGYRTRQRRQRRAWAHDALAGGLAGRSTVARTRQRPTSASSRRSVTEHHIAVSRGVSAAGSSARRGSSTSCAPRRDLSLQPSRSRSPATRRRSSTPN